MIRHLWKYKYQTLISVIVLPVKLWTSPSIMFKFNEGSKLLALFMAIVLCIGGKVYRTSCEKPG